jgi:hypothetical protein
VVREGGFVNISDGKAEIRRRFDQTRFFKTASQTLHRVFSSRKNSSQSKAVAMFENIFIITKETPKVQYMKSSTTLKQRR